MVFKLRVARRHPQLLRPRLLREARRGPRDHHHAAGHPDPSRQLSGRMHRAVRRRPLADALAVHVVTPAAFQTWLSSRAERPAAVGRRRRTRAAARRLRRAASAAAAPRLEHLELGLAARAPPPARPCSRARRLRRLPHARRRRHDRHGRPESRHTRSCPTRKKAGMPLKPFIKTAILKPERVHRPRLPAGRHAAEFRSDPDADADPGARQLPLERDKVRGRT